MKKTFLIAIISLVTISNSFCQTKMEDIKELIALIHKEKALDESYDVFIKMLKPQMEKYRASYKNNNALMDSLIQDEITFSKRFYSENMPLIYDRLFSHNEIKEYLKFYKTTAGQKLINSQSVIQKEMMDSVSKYISGMKEKFKAKLEEGNSETNVYKLDSAKAKEIKIG